MTPNLVAKLVACLLSAALAACGGGGTEAADGPPAQSDAAVTSDAGDGGADAAPAPDGPAASPTLPEDLPQPLPSGAPNVRLVTYNTALLATIKGSPQRIPPMVDAIKQVHADVLCLQEVWTAFTTPQDFAAQVAEAFPYSYWFERHTTTLGSGVLLVSKHPLYRGRSHPFATQEPGGFFDKAVIGVDVVTSDSYFHVMCTHTASPTDASGPPLRFAQIDEINAFAAAEGYDAAPLFLLGDLNTGPDPTQSCTPTTTPACNEPDVASYGKLLETYADPNADWQQCTWCRAVALPLQISGVSNADPDQRVDHCLYAGLDTSVFKSRDLVLDQTVAIQMGSVTLEHYSDHFGVRCTFGH